MKAAPPVGFLSVKRLPPPTPSFADFVRVFGLLVTSPQSPVWVPVVFEGVLGGFLSSFISEGDRRACEPLKAFEDIQRGDISLWESTSVVFGVSQFGKEADVGLEGLWLESAPNQTTVPMVTEQEGLPLSSKPITTTSPREKKRKERKNQTLNSSPVLAKTPLDFSKSR